MLGPFSTFGIHLRVHPKLKRSAHPLLIPSSSLGLGLIFDNCLTTPLVHHRKLCTVVALFVIEDNVLLVLPPTF